MARGPTGLTVRGSHGASSRNYDSGTAAPLKQQMKQAESTRAKAGAMVTGSEGDKRQPFVKRASGWILSAVLRAISVAVIITCCSAPFCWLLMNTDSGLRVWSAFSQRYPDEALSINDTMHALQQEMGALHQMWQPAADALWVAGVETAEAAVAWSRALAATSAPLMAILWRITLLLLPIAGQVALQLWSFQCSLPAPLLAAELLLILLSALSVWLKRYLARNRSIERLQARVATIRCRVAAVTARYQRRLASVRTSVAARSRTAAAALPHVTFATCCIITAAVFPEYTNKVAVFGRETVLYTVPLGLSLWSLLDAEQGALRRRLMYWVVFASFHAACDLWWSMPFISKAANWLPWQSELVFFAGLYALLPLGGLTALFNVTVRSLSSHLSSARRLHEGQEAFSAFQASGKTILQSLSRFGIISEATSTALIENIVDASSLAVGLVFVFTPSPITRIGVVYVGYFLPVSSTMRSLAASGTPAARLYWLKFWIIQVTYTLIFSEVYASIGWIPLMPLDQLNVLFLIWLQLPYFHGVDVISSLASSHLGSLLASGGAAAAGDSSEGGNSSRRSSEAGGEETSGPRPGATCSIGSGGEGDSDRWEMVDEPAHRRPPLTQLDDNSRLMPGGRNPKKDQ